MLHCYGRMEQFGFDGGQVGIGADSWAFGWHAALLVKLAAE